MPKPAPHRISRITLDQGSVVKCAPEIEREREIAIRDLLAHNYFLPEGAPAGPYHLNISVAENRLCLDIAAPGKRTQARVAVSLTPFRRVVKDYFLICDSYYAALRQAHPSRIEAIDMGRRGIHDEGARLLMQRLKGKIELDTDTARRLFTLICVLHLRG